MGSWQVGTTLVDDEPVTVPAAGPADRPAEQAQVAQPSRRTGEGGPPAGPGAAGDAGGALSSRRVRLVFLALMLALLLAALEQMIVATALPKIVGELHGLDRMSWAITAYLLTATVGLPIYGTVATADGTPLGNVVVTLADARGEVVASTRSGHDGAYALGELVAGAYTLAATAPGFRPAALPVAVRAARETRQDVELAGGAVLRGTVRAYGGRPVEDARVTLLDAAGNVVGSGTTGSDGAYRFVDLSAGEYTAIAAGYPPVATVLRVEGGGRTERDLRRGHGD